MLLFLQQLLISVKPPPSVNHLPDSVSTSLKFFVAQFFWAQTPFRAKYTYAYRSNTNHCVCYCNRLDSIWCVWSTL